MTCVLRSYDVRSDNFKTKTFASKLGGIFATLESRTSRPWQEMGLYPGVPVNQNMSWCAG